MKKKAAPKKVAATKKVAAKKVPKKRVAKKKAPRREPRPPDPQPESAVIKIPGLGEFAFENERWQSSKKKRFAKFGNLPVVFTDEEAIGPTKQQIAAVGRFKKRAEKLFRIAERALVDFYEEWAVEMGEPPLKRDKDVWKPMELDELLIPPHGQIFLVNCGASWCDRSITIRLEKSKGSAGLLGWFHYEFYQTEL